MGVHRLADPGKELEQIPVSAGSVLASSGNSHFPDKSLNAICTQFVIQIIVMASFGVYPVSRDRHS